MMSDAIPSDQSAEIPPAASAEPQADAESADSRTYRQRILDAFEDNEGDLTVAHLMQDTALSRNAVDSTLSVMVKRGLVLRVAQGLYRKAPPAPKPEPLRTRAEVPRADGVSGEQWLEWLWSWHRGGKWEGPGEAPDRVDGILIDACLVPMDCWAVFQGELAAVLQREAEDAALRDRLVSHAAGNVVLRSPKLDDVRPLRVMLASGITIDEIEAVIKAKHDRRLSPRNPPLSSWVDLFELVAVHHHRFVLAKRTAAKWRERLADASSTTDASPALRRAMSEIASGTDAGAPHSRLGRASLRKFEV